MTSAAGQYLWLGITLTQRDLAQRYRGTVLGKIWPFLYAALLLAVFTFVFSVVLKVRWGTAGSSAPSFGALMIFCGLVPYLFLSEVLVRAPAAVTSMPNFVKKIRFPLPLLPIVIVFSALTVMLINCTILMVAIRLFAIDLSGKALLLPMVFVPLLFLAVGLALFLAALGVFFRDLTQLAPLLAQLLMFLAPVCYPAEAVPPSFQTVLHWNPLTWFVDTFRALLLDGSVPPVESWMAQIAGWMLFAAAGLWFFRRTQRMFADLL